MDAVLTHFGSTGLATALGVTVLAGMATSIGSALAFFVERNHLRLLAWALAFSGGVMLYVSFVEILPKGAASLATHFGEAGGAWRANAGFFLGFLAMALIDLLVPAAENPHELRAAGDMQQLKSTPAPGFNPLWRAGVLTALAIGVHNFPEGMATLLAMLDDPRTGLGVAVAIALHNIPEGISVAVPVFFATGRRGLAFALASLSGLAEPIGGLLGALTLGWLLPLQYLGSLFGAIAGIMVYISIDVLLPTARQYGHSHEVLGGVAAGMATMAGSLLLLG
jgi:ZIP family zinc transporter